MQNHIICQTMSNHTNLFKTTTNHPFTALIQHNRNIVAPGVPDRSAWPNSNSTALESASKWWKPSFRQDQKGIIWGFPWGVYPKIMWNPNKMDDLGVAPYFRKPPYGIISCKIYHKGMMKNYTTKKKTEFGSHVLFRFTILLRFTIATS